MSSSGTGRSDTQLTRRFLTAKEAAQYLGYKNPATLRKLVGQGLLAAAGRRGGMRTLTFAIDELDRFMVGKNGGIDTEDRSGAPHGEPEPDEKTVCEKVGLPVGPDPIQGSVRGTGRRIRSQSQSDGPERDPTGD